MRKFLASVAIVFSLAGTAQAQDFQKGLAAAEAYDFATALQEWKPLAEQGFAPAQFNLGLMYETGRGVPQDYKEAVKWYRKASEQGAAKPQTNLGYMYQQGQGVLQDNILAHMWYNISSANGEGLGAENRDKIAKEMPAEDISKAQAMARECMASGYQNCGY